MHDDKPMQKARHRYRILFLAALLPAYFTLAQSGWTDLFNGKNLEGWTERNKSGSFHVENGAIVGTATSGLGTTFLCTDEEYGDFDLEFECKLIDPELNSGVQIRSRIRKLPGKDTGPLEGPQVDISGKTPERGTFSGNIFGQGWGQWLTPKDQRRNHKFFKGGEWNKFRVLAKGDQVTTWINGEMVITTTIPAERHATHPSGYIALQLHGIHEGTGPFKIAWRNLRVSKLTEAATPSTGDKPAAKVEVKQAARPSAPGVEVAQGFQTYEFELKDGSVASGFVTDRNNETIKLRNVLGMSQTIQASAVDKEEVLKVSMMPTGLVDALTLRQFASLIDYLQTLH